MFYLAYKTHRFRFHGYTDCDMKTIESRGYNLVNAFFPSTKVVHLLGLTVNCVSSPGLTVYGVSGPAHTTPEEFENGGVFFSTVTPTVHTNPSLKPSLSKTLLKPEEFENACFSFSCGRKTV